LVQKDGSEGSGYYWEDCLCRFFMLSLRSISGKRISIGEASIMKKFVEIDPTIYFYTFEGTYVIDEKFSKIDFTKYLLSRNTTNIYYPNKFVGNDITITCSKLTLEECKKICEFFSIKLNDYDKLPLTRTITIQAKFLTKDKNVDSKTLKYASQTCLIENSYNGKKKNENSKNRKEFEYHFFGKDRMNNSKININKKNISDEIIDWNIGIVCIAGKIPEDYEEKKMLNK